MHACVHQLVCERNYAVGAWTLVLAIDCQNYNTLLKSIEWQSALIWLDWPSAIYLLPVYRSFLFHAHVSTRAFIRAPSSCYSSEIDRYACVSVYARAHLSRLINQFDRRISWLKFLRGGQMRTRRTDGKQRTFRPLGLSFVISALLFGQQWENQPKLANQWTHVNAMDSHNYRMEPALANCFAKSV